jgi:hypothetical protein
MTFPSRRSWLALSGYGQMSAQNPSGKYMPVNAVANGDGGRVFLEGAR